MKKSLLSPQMESRKQELNNELVKISAIEAQEIINQHYEQIKKKYEGKYFKCDNGYNDTERWWLYIKVVKINPDDIYDTNGNGVTSRYKGWSFQTTSDGQITIDKIRHSYVHNLEKQISKKEFVAAWNKMVVKMDELE